MRKLQMWTMHGAGDSCQILMGCMMCRSLGHHGAVGSCTGCDIFLPFHPLSKLVILLNL